MFQMPHKCTACSRIFSRKYNRDRHFTRQHAPKSPETSIKHKCPFCYRKTIIKHFKSKELLVQHVDQAHLDSLKYQLVKAAFDGQISFFSKRLVTLQPLENFLSDEQNIEDIFKVIKHQLSKYDVVTVAIIVTADYRIPSLEQHVSATQTNNVNNTNADSLPTTDVDNTKLAGNSGESGLHLAEERDQFTLRTKRKFFNVHQSPEEALKNIRTLLQTLLDREQDLLMRGSGWQFEGLQSCDIEIISQSNI